MSLCQKYDVTIVHGWYSDNCLFLEDLGVYLGSGT